MAASGWELVGEVRLGAELSFDEACEAEAGLRDALAELLEPYAVPWLDIRTTGDGFVFACSPRAGGPEDFREVCKEFGARMDPGGQARMVLVGEGFGPVLAWRFTTEGAWKEWSIS